MDDVFAPGGALEGVLPEYEPRREQAAVLVETNRPGGEVEFAGQFPDGVSDGHGLTAAFRQTAYTKVG